MLYRQWLRTVRDAADREALRDLASGRSWTFRELAAHVDTLPPVDEAVCFPWGQSVEFVFQVLRAWRSGRVVCPLEAGQAPPEAGRVPEECRHLKLTSGATGAPRCVAFTEAQLAADAGNIMSTMKLDPGSPNLGFISLAHSYGYSNLVLPLLLHGIPLTIAPAPLPELVRGALNERSGWTVAAVPALWRAWFQAGAIDSNIRTAISAGAPLPLDLEQAVFESTGVKIHNFLGSSECGGIAYDRTPEPRTDSSLAGSPLDNVAAGINEDNCLTVGSAAVGLTYLPEPDEALRGGSFETQDLAEIRRGFIHLRGRAGDRINVAGRKLSPESVEQVLQDHPAVTDCVVFGIPSSRGDRHEEIVAAVAGDRLDEAALKRHLAGLLPGWQLPRLWWFVEGIETDVRGKISRREWRERFLEQHPS